MGFAMQMLAELSESSNIGHLHSGVQVSIIMLVNAWKSYFCYYSSQGVGSTYEIYRQISLISVRLKSIRHLLI